MGKTRLAVEVAGVVSGDYAAGGAFVDLVPTGSVISAVAAALGVAELPGRPIDRPVLDRLRRGRTLLVLDNCEHLVDDAAELVGRILADCPLAVVLATSRERLGIPGERVVDVPPLTEAVELFRSRAGTGFAASTAEITEICACVDGLPLAVELAAARAASLGAAGLLAALEDRLRLLSGGRGVAQRHRSLRAVLDWSHELLDDAERAVFGRLAIFNGGFDLDAAAAVHPGGGRAEVADLVGRLVDKSLVVRGDRWRLLETVRAFAWECLSPAEQREVRRLHLGWAATTDAPFAEVADDMRAALAASAPVPDATAHRLARSLARQTFVLGRFSEAHEHFLAAARRAGSAVDGCADLRAAAHAAIVVADGPVALPVLLEEADRAADGRGRADALAHAVITTVRYRATVTDEHRAALLAMAEAADPTAGMVAAARAWHAWAVQAPDALALAEAAVVAAGDPSRRWWRGTRSATPSPRRGACARRTGIPPTGSA